MRKIGVSLYKICFWNDLIRHTNLQKMGVAVLVFPIKIFENWPRFDFVKKKQDDEVIQNMSGDYTTPIDATFKKSKIELKIVKIKISKNGLRHKLPTTQTNLYTKFHENPSITLAYIAILVRTENRRKKFYCCFSLLEAWNVPKKSFSAIGKKRTHWPYSNICPSGLRTYKQIDGDWKIHSNDKFIVGPKDDL